jgi:hypothetical protein
MAFVGCLRDRRTLDLHGSAVHNFLKNQILQGGDDLARRHDDDLTPAPMGQTKLLLSHEDQKKTPASVFQPGPGPGVGGKGGIETPERIQIRHGVRTV